MDKKRNGRQPEYPRHCQALTGLDEAELEVAVGGLNPQPLPPGAFRALLWTLRAEPVPVPW